MIRLISAFLAILFLVGPATEPVSARPDFLARFQADPFKRTGVDGCAVCHDNPQGGGTRNDFGTAFDGAGRVITPMIRANFPDQPSLGWD